MVSRDQKWRMAASAERLSTSGDDRLDAAPTGPEPVDEGGAGLTQGGEGRHVVGVPGRLEPRGDPFRSVRSIHPTLQRSVFGTAG